MNRARVARAERGRGVAFPQNCRPAPPAGSVLDRCQQRAIGAGTVACQASAEALENFEQVAVSVGPDNFAVGDRHAARSRLSAIDQRRIARQDDEVGAADVVIVVAVGLHPRGTEAELAGQAGHDRPGVEVMIRDVDDHRRPIVFEMTIVDFERFAGQQMDRDGVAAESVEDQQVEIFGRLADRAKCARRPTRPRRCDRLPWPCS